MYSIRLSCRHFFLGLIVFYQNHHAVSGTTDGVICKNDRIYFAGGYTLTHSDAMNRAPTHYTLANFGDKTESDILEFFQNCCIFELLPKLEYWIARPCAGNDCKTITIQTNTVKLQSRPCGDKYHALYEQRFRRPQCSMKAYNTITPQTSSDWSMSTASANALLMSTNSSTQTTSSSSAVTSSNLSPAVTFASSSSEIHAGQTLILNTVTDHEGDSNLTGARVTTNTPPSGWKTIIDNRAYFINRERLPYNKAENVCRQNNASLVWFISTESYAGIVRVLGLETGMYWVGGATQNIEQSGKALFLNVSIGGNGTLSVIVANSSQDMQFYSICSTIVNVSDVLDNPNFKQMIKDLTIETKKTRNAQRKLMSVDNKEASSKMLGVGLGVVLLVCVFGSICMMDIGRLFSSCQYGRRILRGNIHNCESNA